MWIRWVALVTLTFVTLSRKTDACVTPEKDVNFDDFALRSDIVVEGVLARNVVKKKPKFSATFRVTTIFSTKAGKLKLGNSFVVGDFGSASSCLKPKFGKKYVFFLSPSTAPRIRGRPRRFVNRYNPVGSSKRNLKLFKSVLEGTYEGETILRSGCKKMSKPDNGAVSCSPDKMRCVTSCKKGFLLNGGPKFKVCQTTTGLWYPFKSVSCVPEPTTTSTTSTDEIILASTPQSAISNIKNPFTDTIANKATSKKKPVAKAKTGKKRIANRRKTKRGKKNSGGKMKTAPRKIIRLKSAEGGGTTSISRRYPNLKGADAQKVLVDNLNSEQETLSDSHDTDLSMFSNEEDSTTTTFVSSTTTILSPSTTEQTPPPRRSTPSTRKIPIMPTDESAIPTVSSTISSSPLTPTEIEIPLFLSEEPDTSPTEKGESILTSKEPTTTTTKPVAVSEETDKPVLTTGVIEQSTITTAKVDSIPQTPNIPTTKSTVIVSSSEVPITLTTNRYVETENRSLISEAPDSFVTEPSVESRKPNATFEITDAFTTEQTRDTATPVFILESTTPAKTTEDIEDPVTMPETVNASATGASMITDKPTYFSERQNTTTTILIDETEAPTSAFKEPVELTKETATIVSVTRESVEYITESSAKANETVFIDPNTTSSEPIVDASTDPVSGVSEVYTVEPSAKPNETVFIDPNATTTESFIESTEPVSIKLNISSTDSTLEISGTLSTIEDPVTSGIEIATQTAEMVLISGNISTTKPVMNIDETSTMVEERDMVTSKSMVESTKSVPISEEFETSIMVTSSTKTLVSVNTSTTKPIEEIELSVPTSLELNISTTESTQQIETITNELIKELNISATETIITTISYQPDPTAASNKTDSISEVPVTPTTETIIVSDISTTSQTEGPTKPISIYTILNGTDPDSTTVEQTFESTAAPNETVTPTTETIIVSDISTTSQTEGPTKPISIYTILNGTDPDSTTVEQTFDPTAAPNETDSISEGPVTPATEIILDIDTSTTDQTEGTTNPVSISTLVNITDPITVTVEQTFDPTAAPNETDLISKGPVTPATEIILVSDASTSGQTEGTTNPVSISTRENVTVTSTVTVEKTFDSTAAPNETDLISKGPVIPSTEIILISDTSTTGQSEGTSIFKTYPSTTTAEPAAATEPSTAYTTKSTEETQKTTTTTHQLTSTEETTVKPTLSTSPPILSTKELDSTIKPSILPEASSSTSTERPVTTKTITTTAKSISSTKETVTPTTLLTTGLPVTSPKVTLSKKPVSPTKKPTSVSTKKPFVVSKKPSPKKPITPSKPPKIPSKKPETPVSPTMKPTPVSTKKPFFVSKKPSPKKPITPSKPPKIPSKKPETPVSPTMKPTPVSTEKPFVVSKKPSPKKPITPSKPPKIPSKKPKKPVSPTKKPTPVSTKNPFVVSKKPSPKKPITPSKPPKIPSKKPETPVSPTMKPTPVSTKKPFVASKKPSPKKPITPSKPPKIPSKKPETPVSPTKKPTPGSTKKPFVVSKKPSPKKPITPSKPPKIPSKKPETPVSPTMKPTPVSTKKPFVASKKPSPKKPITPSKPPKSPSKKPETPVSPTKKPTPVSIIKPFVVSKKPSPKKPITPSKPPKIPSKKPISPVEKPRKPTEKPTKKPLLPRKPLRKPGAGKKPTLRRKPTGSRRKPGVAPKKPATPSKAPAKKPTAPTRGPLKKPVTGKRPNLRRRKPLGARRRPGVAPKKPIGTINRPTPVKQKPGETAKTPNVLIKPTSVIEKPVTTATATKEPTKEIIIQTTEPPTSPKLSPTTTKATVSTIQPSTTTKELKKTTVATTIPIVATKIPTETKKPTIPRQAPAKKPTAPKRGPLKKPLTGKRPNLRRRKPLGTRRRPGVAPKKPTGTTKPVLTRQKPSETVKKPEVPTKPTTPIQKSTTTATKEPTTETILQTTEPPTSPKSTTSSTQRSVSVTEKPAVTKKTVTPSKAPTKKPVVTRRGPLKKPVWGKRPALSRKKPIAGIKKPGEIAKKPVGTRKKPGMAKKKPGLSVKKPAGAQKKPFVGKKKPGIQGKKPGLARKKPLLARKKPGFGKKQPVKKPPIKRRPVPTKKPIKKPLPGKGKLGLKPVAKGRTGPKPVVGKAIKTPTTTKSAAVSTTEEPTTTIAPTTTEITTTRKTTTTKPTTTTPKTRPTMPTYRALQPITRRPAYPRRPTTRPPPRLAARGRLGANSGFRPLAPARPPIRARPSLPIFRPLVPLSNRPILPRPVGTFSPESVAILKKVPNVPGKELDQIDDKFAVAKDGDAWQGMDDGLNYKPQLTINKTVYGCPYYESNITVFSFWPGGFNAMVNFSRLTKPMMNGWIVKIQFESPILDIETHVVNFFIATDDRKTVAFLPKPYMAVLHYNQDLTVAFIGKVGNEDINVPRGRALLMGKCTDDILAGKVVGNMFQGQKVLEKLGNGTKAKEVPSAPTRPPAVSRATATEQTPAPRRPGAAGAGVRRPGAAGAGARRPGTAGAGARRPGTAGAGARRPGTARRPGAAPRRTARPRSAFKPRPGNIWPANRCLAKSANGVLPEGGLTRPKWSKSSSKKSIYDYNEVLHKSGLFYMAQKSGKLPKIFPIPWRGDSALKDGCNTGDALFGGLYSGAGYEKSTLAIAFTTTMLAWGGIDYKSAYTAAGEYDDLVKIIKSNANYLIRCHTSANELVVQIGDYDSSGTKWTRPEELDVEGRKIYKINTKNPGQDVAAETAAALAAAGFMFKSTDSKFSQECLLHARQLYSFAQKYPGKYSQVIPSTANRYHTTSDTLDDLVWAMLWMGKATGNKAYFERAEAMYKKITTSPVNLFYWEDKTNALPILLAKFTKKKDYLIESRKLIIKLAKNGTRTPSKQLWLHEKGTNMHTANSAFLALQTAMIYKRFPFGSIAASFAEEQLHLLLGDGERSYVVGFGKNYPKRPHHMASSCLDPPAKCDASRLRISADSPHTLYGALVGGPDQQGKYNDYITEQIQNEVAIDFNAGFQSAIAGLREMQLPGKYLIKSSSNQLRRVGQPVRKNNAG
ncbi:uncharacterized protein LOC120335261 [Styela clava]